MIVQHTDYDYSQRGIIERNDKLVIAKTSIPCRYYQNPEETA